MQAKVTLHKTSKLFPKPLLLREELVPGPYKKWLRLWQVQTGSGTTLPGPLQRRLGQIKTTTIESYLIILVRPQV